MRSAHAGAAPTYSDVMLLLEAFPHASEDMRDMWLTGARIVLEKRKKAPILAIAKHATPDRRTDSTEA